MSLQLILALRYLNGRKLRTFLTTLAVTFGVLVIFSMNLILPSFLNALQATMLAASNAVDLTISQKSGGTFPQAASAQAAGVEGIRASHGLLARPLNLPVDYFDQDPAKPDAISVVNLTGLDLPAAETVRHFTILTGRFLQPGDQDAAVIAQSLADSLGLAVGDSLPLPTTQGIVALTIVGIAPPLAVPGNEEILMTLPEAQRLLDSPGQISLIEANVDTTVETRRAEIEQTVQNRLGPGYQTGALPTTTDIFSNLKLAQTMLNAFGAMALFMGAFIIFNTFRTVVAERRRDIGMLRALGATRRIVLGVVLMEGLIQGTVGALTGMFFGFLLAYGGLKALAPLASQFVRMEIGSPVITPGLILTALGLGIGVTLLAGLQPALSAGRVTPMEALRPSLSPVEYRRSLGASAIAGIVMVGLALAALFSGSTGLISLGAVLFLAGLIMLTPALTRPVALAFGAILARIYARQGTGYLAQGNLTRQPGRVAITASTIMIALAIIVMGGELAVSINNGFLGVMKKNLGSDYLMIPPAVGVWSNNVGSGGSLVERLRAIDGVGPVSTLRFSLAAAEIKPSAIASLKGGNLANEAEISLMAIDPVNYPLVSGFKVIEGQADQVYRGLADGRTMLINGPFSANLGVKVGDLVPLLTPQGIQDYRVIGVVGDYFNAKLVTAYISQANLARDFGKTEDIFIQLNLKPGADAAAVEAALKEIKADYPQYTLSSGKAYYEQTRKLFSQVFSLVYLIFAFLAIPSLIAMLNTLAIGVIERTREIGMVRAVGASQAQVRRMVTAESLLLAGLGVSLGLLTGLYLGYLMVAAFQSGGFPVNFYFPWAGLIFTAAIGLLFGLLAAIVPARQAARLEIVSALRYE